MKSNLKMKMSYILEGADSIIGLSAIIAILFGMIINILAYITHLIWVVKVLIGPGELLLKEAILMVIGIIIPFIGVINGWYIWLS